MDGEVWTSPGSTGPGSLDPGCEAPSSRWLWLRHEWLPVEGGEVGFILLLASVALHFWIAILGVDPQGQLFRSGVVVEALGLSLVLMSPALATYAGLRSMLRNRESFLPYLTVPGGAFLALLTILACVLASR